MSAADWLPADEFAPAAIDTLAVSNASDATLEIRNAWGDGGDEGIRTLETVSRLLP